MISLLLIVIGIVLVVRGTHLIDLSTYSRGPSDEADILTACHLSAARDMVHKGVWVSHDDIDTAEIDLRHPHRN